MFSQILLLIYTNLFRNTVIFPFFPYSLFYLPFCGISGFLHGIFDWAPLNLIKFPRPNGHGLLQPISPRPSGWICQRRTNPKPGTASIVLGNIASQALTRIRGLLAPVRLVHLSALHALIDWPYRSKRQHSPIHDEYLSRSSGKSERPCCDQFNLTHLAASQPCLFDQFRWEWK